jgi:hypothetical protein
MPTNPTPIPIPAAAALEIPPVLGGPGAGTAVVPLNLVLGDIALDSVLDDMAELWGGKVEDEVAAVIVGVAPRTAR